MGAKALKSRGNAAYDAQVKARNADNRERLRRFAARAGLRPDWHEPDIDCKVVGTHLDNANGDGEDVWTNGARDHQDYAEYVVVLRGYHDEEGSDVLRINLANLLALATEEP